MPSKEHDSLADFLSAQPVATAMLSISEQRQNYEKLLKLNPIPEDVEIVGSKIGICNVDWVSVSNDPKRVLLYLHGGGYVIGSNIGYREFAGRLARSLDARVCLLDYRLAPENPFPAALEDSIACYNSLLGQGWSAENIIVAGDSAGGGLALASLLALRDINAELPAGVICLSPWVDLLGTGESSKPGVVEDDPLLDDSVVAFMTDQYASSDDLKNPLVSPLFGDYSGFPPVQIFVGTREKLLDDSRRLAIKLQSYGVTTDYFEEPGLIHVWPVIIPSAPETADALNKMADFAESYC